LKPAVTFVAKTPWIDRALHAVLTHHAIVPLKHALRDGYWKVAGRSIANPPLSATVRSVLFVCKGNICRSPFAAGLAHRLAQEAGLSGLRIASAGLAASQAARSPQEACTTAAEYGVRLGLEPPVQISAALAAEFDAIVAMEAWQAIELRNRFPALRDRVFLLPLVEQPPAFGYARYHIEDPFGHGYDAFVASFSRIERALRAFVGALSSARGPARNHEAHPAAGRLAADRREARDAASSARR
jgi:protein-tyrosine phosphatase